MYVSVVYAWVMCAHTCARAHTSRHTSVLMCMLMEAKGEGGYAAQSLFYFLGTEPLTDPEINLMFRET